MLCDGCQMGGEKRCLKLIVLVHDVAVLFLACVLPTLLVSKMHEKRHAIRYSGRPKRTMTNY